MQTAATETPATKDDIEAYIDKRLKALFNRNIVERLRKTKREEELVDEKLNEKVSTRLREAREFADMKQLAAAQRLGYQNSGALSKMENWSSHSDRSIPIALIVRASVLYGVSADYLLGLSEFYENDHESLTKRYVARSVLDTWEKAREEDLAAILTIAHDVATVSSAIMEISRLAGELEQSIDAMRAKNKTFPEGEDRPEGFDDLLGSNKVLTEMGRLRAEVRRCASKLWTVRQKTIRPTNRRTINTILQRLLDLGGEPGR